jgi:hypothetical protein
LADFNREKLIQMVGKQIEILNKEFLQQISTKG